MKICLIGDMRSIHFRRWINWLIKREHRVYVITDYPREMKDVKIYGIKRKNGGIFNIISDMLETKKIVRKIKPDILHAHYIAGYGTFAAFTNYHPFIVSAWGSDILIAPKRSIFQKMAVKYAIKRADVVHIENEIEHNIIKKLGGKGKRMIVAPFGVDVNKFTPEKRNKKDGHVVISTRNLEKIYDIQTLIRAIPEVIKKIPDTKFVVAGSGKLKNELITLAKKLNVEKHVNFLGQISHDELSKYLANSEVYVSTSLSDTISVSLLEAMASGVVPVVTDIEGNRILIKDGYNGFLFPPSNEKLLAEKIIILLQNINLRKKIGEINRKIVIERYDWDKNMKKIEKLYEELGRREN